MNFLKPDSPVMDFLRTVTNLVIVNILFIICSIPVITFGAAYTAKYYVAMKVIRGEGTGVVIPFFKAFKRNFKQATGVWIVMLVAIFLIIFDWRWITYNGWSNTEFIYKFGVIAFSVAVLLMTMAIFPTIARYDMKTSELFKAALIFVIIKFIPLVLIVLLIIVSAVACLWYMQWFPLVYVFTSTTITYFLSIIFIKQFDKLEKAQAEKLKALEESVEYDPETDAVGNISLAGSKKEISKLEKDMEGSEAKPADKSGNKLANFFKTEKEKLKGLTAKQKAIYFMQYYVPPIILVILVIGGICWYGHDVYKSKMRVLGGGVINGYPSEDGRKYATDGFLSWGGYGKARWASLIDSEDLNFKSDIEYEDKYLEVAFRATLVTGTYDYLIMREDAVYNYSTPDNFQDLSQLLNMDNFSEDDFYYYVATEEEKAKRSQGISLNDLFGGGNKTDLDKPVPLALKLTDDIEKKLGLDEKYDYYIAFTYSISSGADANYRKFVEYLYGKC
ncbi:MAG: YesL family protein [Clostridiales bacterium]|nr:YesL family protein [Clostridiales bacterium]